jgi:excisionase family DNA binding protein
MALLTIKEACEALGISRSTLYLWRKNIPAVAAAVRTPPGVKAIRLDADALGIPTDKARTDG